VQVDRKEPEAVVDNDRVAFVEEIAH
jgi:hypothetical protein